MDPGIYALPTIFCTIGNTIAIVLKPVVRGDDGAVGDNAPY